MARREFKKYERRYEQVDAEIEDFIRWATDRSDGEELVETLCEFFAEWVKRDKEQRFKNLILSLQGGK